MKRYYIALLILGIVAAAAILAQALTAGPVKADAELVKRLEQVRGEIDTYATDNGHLPASLDDLTRIDMSGVSYYPGSSGTYQICATFQTSTTSGRTPTKYASEEYTYPTDHAKGYQCFKGKAPLQTPPFAK